MEMDAVKEQHGEQGNDQGHDIEYVHQQAVDQTEQRPQHQRQDDYHKSGQAVSNVQGGGKHAAQCQLTADRHVTSAADHDHGVAHHHNAKHGDLAQNVQQVAGGQKLSVECGEYNDENGQDHKQAVFFIEFIQIHFALPFFPVKHP